jgi:predicted aspartyl protease
MPKALCGFDSLAGGASGSEFLVAYGPTLVVNVGFDPDFKEANPTVPKIGTTKFAALVDTGATECAIDSLLAAQLNLPVVDRRKVAGIGGAHEVNVHLAQVFVVSLGFTVYGAFMAVHLNAGGQRHHVLLGRTFLKHYKMVYEGVTGTVIIESPLPPLPPKPAPLPASPAP